MQSGHSGLELLAGAQKGLWTRSHWGQKAGVTGISVVFKATGRMGYWEKEKKKTQDCPLQGHCQWRRGASDINTVTTMRLRQDSRAHSSSPQACSSQRQSAWLPREELGSPRGPLPSLSPSPLPTFKVQVYPQVTARGHLGLRSHIISEGPPHPHCLLPPLDLLPEACQGMGCFIYLLSSFLLSAHLGYKHHESRGGSQCPGQPLAPRRRFICWMKA